MEEFNFLTGNEDDRRLNQDDENVDYYFDFLKYSYKYSTEDEGGSLFPEQFPCEGYTSVLSMSTNNNGDVVLGMYVMGDTMNWSLDPISGEWESRAFLPTSRRNHVTVKVKEYIWLLGGVDPKSGVPVKDVDVYHVLFDYWITIPYSSLTYLFHEDDNNDSEIIEAFTLSDKYVYVLTYHPTTNTNKMTMIDADKLILQNIPYSLDDSNDAENTTISTTSSDFHEKKPEFELEDIFIPRSSLAISRDSGVTLIPFRSRFIFAVGGQANSSNNKEDHSTNNIVEVYDAKYNQWATLREKLNHGRINANILLYEDIIYVFGGDHVSISTASWMERYDPHTGKNGPWKRVRSSFISSYSTWDFITIVASYQLQTWYFLATKKVPVIDDNSGLMDPTSFSCEHELYVFYPPYQKVSTKWTKTKYALQDQLDDSLIVQRFRSGIDQQGTFVISSIGVGIAVVLSAFLYRRFRQKTSERAPLTSHAEFEMHGGYHDRDFAPEFT